MGELLERMSAREITEMMAFDRLRDEEQQVAEELARAKARVARAGRG